MAITNLAVKSLYNRRTTAILTLLAIAISVTLLLGVERIRTQTRENFANTISGTDLIVGARSGPTQLLLYSVFRMGSATSNITWDSYQHIANQRGVKWSIPISLGDSHRGYRVIGTNQDYFKHYQFGRKQHLELKQGEPFDQVFEAVLGSEVARQLGYKLDDSIALAHGIGNTSFSKHDDKPFTVVGILAPTGTPVDRSVHVSLEAIEAIHVDWKGGAAPRKSQRISAEQALQQDLSPKQITAFLLGLDSKLFTFKLQREINQYRGEPLLAILPGVALHELWQMMGVAEKALVVISVFVVITGLIGMLTTLMASLNERRREMAILRSLGARPGHIFGLLVSEAGLLASLGAILGVGLLYLLLSVSQTAIQSRFGLYFELQALSEYEIKLLLAVIVAGFTIGLIPALRAYRYSLSDGMTIRT